MTVVSQIVWKFWKSMDLIGIVPVNLPQRNYSVYNKTRYGNFEIVSTLAKYLRVLEETLEVLANLELVDDSHVIHDGESMFLEIPAYNINKNF